jgi:hypothetical protein
VYEIAAVLDQWYEPLATYFKVQTVEGKIYLLRYDEERQTSGRCRAVLMAMSYETRHHLDHGRCRCDSSSGETNRILRTLSSRRCRDSIRLDSG